MEQIKHCCCCYGWKDTWIVTWLPSTILQNVSFLHAIKTTHHRKSGDPVIYWKLHQFTWSLVWISSVFPEQMSPRHHATLTWNDGFYKQIKQNKLAKFSGRIYYFWDGYPIFPLHFENFKIVPNSQLQFNFIQIFPKSLQDLTQHSYPMEFLIVLKQLNSSQN